MSEPSRLRPARQPWEPTPEQERARIRFHEVHCGVLFQRLREPFPHWIAMWVTAGGHTGGVTDTDFGDLLAEVFKAFAWEDPGEKQGAAGAGGS